LEPAWHGAHSEPRDLLFLFVDLHLDAKRFGVEVKKHTLVGKAEALVCLRDDAIDVLVDGLFDVDLVAINLGHVSVNVTEGTHPLFQF